MLKTASEQRAFGGTIGFYAHESVETKTVMKFAVFVPPIARERKVPGLYYLAGLSCTEETFVIKADALRFAAEHGLALIAPDTSPRGANLPGEDEDWDFGTGAGFYVDAEVAPWSHHYRMYSYVTKELSLLVESAFPVDSKRRGHFRPFHGRPRRTCDRPQKSEPLSVRLGFRTHRKPGGCPLGGESIQQISGTA